MKTRKIYLVVSGDGHLCCVCYNHEKYVEGIFSTRPLAQTFIRTYRPDGEVWATEERLLNKMTPDKAPSRG